MKRIAVLTSGGDAPGMNAAIRGVVRGSIYNNMEVYGIKRGFEGLIEGEIQPMNLSSVSDIIHRGGTMLQTARSQRFTTDDGFQMALNMLNNFRIEALVIIGGDGSLRGGNTLSKAGIQVMGIPGTIDNDLPYTEFTIGFDTAVNTVVSALGNIRETSFSHGRATIVEVMGRNCGDLALYAGLSSGAESILIPEEEPDLSAVCRKMVQGKNRGKRHSLIMKAEGVAIPCEELAKKLQDETGIETRHVILGYLQRGGAPTARDRFLASQMAYRAVECILDNRESSAIGISGSTITAEPLASAIEKSRTYNKDISNLAAILSI